VKCHDHIERTLRMAHDLLEFANESREVCEHDGCLMLDGVIRDCALMLRSTAERWARDLDRLETQRPTRVSH
jgi:hypothetical protein